MTQLKTYYVYIMSSLSGVMYIGMTNDLFRRVHEHKTGENAGFTKRYRVSRLAYYEETDRVEIAIAREKELKKWRRSKKIALIERDNPGWEDLSEGWYS